MTAPNRSSRQWSRSAAPAVTSASTPTLQNAGRQVSCGDPGDSELLGAEVSKMKLVRTVLPVAALAAAACAIETAPCAAANTLTNTAVISNSGNSNFAGFEIVVDSTGNALA